MRTILELQILLFRTSPADIDALFDEEADNFYFKENLFPSYFRGIVKEKHLSQRRIFEKAQIPTHFGYKLIAQETMTRQRDTLLRLFYSAGFTFEEADTALRLYGLPSLYARFPRDAALIVAFNSKWDSIEDLNQYLLIHGFEALRPCGGSDQYTKG